MAVQSSSLLPPGAKWGTVVGAFVDIVPDAPIDADAHPDGRLHTGRVTFTSNAPVFARIGGWGATFKQQTHVLFDGRLGADLGNGVVGIELPATDYAEMEPRSWTWTATIQLDGYQSVTFPFALAPGQVFDLVNDSPVQASAGRWVTKGDPGAHPVASDISGSTLTWVMSDGSQIVSTGALPAVSNTSTTSLTQADVRAALGVL